MIDKLIKELEPMLSGIYKCGEAKWEDYLSNQKPVGGYSIAETLEYVKTALEKAYREGQESIKATEKGCKGCGSKYGAAELDPITYD